MFIAALFRIARTWKQPRCQLTDEWIKNWYIYTIEYYSVIKRNEVESVVVRWMNLKPIVHSEDRKNKYHINTYIWNLEKWFWWTYLQRRNRDVHVENALVDPSGEGEGRTNGESSINIYTLSCVKQTAGEKLLYDTGSPAQCSMMT